MTKTKGLTPKQARFVEEYLIDLNATQAAIRAGCLVGPVWELPYSNVSLATRLLKTLKE